MANYVFIWLCAPNTIPMTHKPAGVVIFANTLDEARRAAKSEYTIPHNRNYVSIKSIIFDEDPDYIYPVPLNGPRMITFPIEKIRCL